MVGGSPLQNNTTVIPTQIFPIIFQLYDSNLNLIATFDPTAPTNLNPNGASDTQNILGSPVFGNTTYGTGSTQFSDAISRAEFHYVAEPNWHNLLGTPTMYPAVAIQVTPPDWAYLVDQNNNPVGYAVEDNFFLSILTVMTELQPLNAQTIPMYISSTLTLFDQPTGACCVLGFHFAQAGNTPNSVQVALWATYLEPGNDIFAPFTDVTPLSHEVNETYNDPFINNVVPAWPQPQPGGGFYPGGCVSNVLETGDPIEALPNAVYAITMLNGVTYGPQTEALLQWFSRQRPSKAIDGAYSYPDETVLTPGNHNAPAGHCGKGSE